MSFELQLLFASDLEGGFTPVIDTAINFAAIVEAIEDDTMPTLLLSAGDNIIPGPTYNAGGVKAAIRGTDDNGQAYNYLDEAFTALFDGDYIEDTVRTGQKEAPGAIDMQLLNIIGFDASVLGNHEFDKGASMLADLIGNDKTIGTLFPYLSANLDFSQDPTFGPGGEFINDFAGTVTDQIVDITPENSGARTIAPAAMFTLEGEKVAVIGATTPNLANVSSPNPQMGINGGGGLNGYPATDPEFEIAATALSAELQPVINAAISDGANKVILLTHLQEIMVEQTLIPKLSGIDVVLAGGSDETYFDDPNNSRTTDTSDDVRVIQNADSQPTYLASVNGLYQTVGELKLSFNDAGVPSLIQAKGYATSDTPQPAAVTFDESGADNTIGRALIVSDMIQGVKTVVETKDQDTFAYTGVFLQGVKPIIRSEETNLGNLKADTQLWFARQQDPTIDVSLVNSGGIRAEIGLAGELNSIAPANTQAVDGYDKDAGAISQLDMENVMKYNNGLVKVETTRAGLVELLEHGVSNSYDGNSPGQYPQVAGMRLSFQHDADFGQASGTQRIQSMVLVDDNDSITDVLVQNGEFQGNPDSPINMVTLNFLAETNGDSYPFNDDPEKGVVGVATAIRDIVDANGNALQEQDAFRAYMSHFHGTSDTAFKVADTPVTHDQRVMNIGRGNIYANDLSHQLNLRRGSSMLSSIDLGGAEIAAYSPEHKAVVVNLGSEAVSSNGTKVSIVDVSDFLNPIQRFTIDLPGEVQAVDISNGLVAAAVANPTDQRGQNGEIAFMSLSGSGSDLDYTYHQTDSVEVGPLPDHLQFNDAGTLLVVANEGESIRSPHIDAEGTISIIDTSSWVNAGSLGFSETRLDFDHLEFSDVSLNLQGIRTNAYNWIMEVTGDVSPNPSYGFSSGMLDKDAEDYGFPDEALDEQYYIDNHNDADFPRGVDIVQYAKHDQPGSLIERASVMQAIEPEGVAILGDRAWVTLQENNAIAEVDLLNNQITDIWSTGIKDWYRGTPEATNLVFDIDYPGGAAPNGVVAGGLSGAWYNGVEDGADTFYVITDRGPQANDLPNDSNTIDLDGINTDKPGSKVFEDPEYPITIYKLANTAAGLQQVESIQLQVPDSDGGFRPVTGIGADLDSHDAAWMWNQAGDAYVPAPRDAYGLDAEAINVIPDAALQADQINGGQPMFAVSDEYFPQVMLFDQATGELVQRYVPEKTDFSGEYGTGQEDVAAFTMDSIPEQYADRLGNRGFEGMAYNSNDGLLYAFIQTPMQPAGYENDEFIRILAIDPYDGSAQAEYLHLLTDVPDGDNPVDKIGDAVYDAYSDRFLIIERDSDTGIKARKPILELDLTGATNVLPLTQGNADGEFGANVSSWSDLIGVAYPEQLDVDALPEAGGIADALAAHDIQFVNRTTLLNIPSTGADARFDKPEGLALKPDGTLMIFNDNDFSPAAGRPDNIATEISFKTLYWDPSNEDGPDDSEVNKLGHHDVYGLTFPDGIDAFEVGGEAFVIVAGEGDDRDGYEDRGVDSSGNLIMDDGSHVDDAYKQNEGISVNDATRVKDVEYDDYDQIGEPERRSFHDHKELVADKRLKLVNTEGDYDGDGQYEQAYAFGSRSFRIFDDNGNLVFDSGTELDEVAKAAGIYDDGRSDDKGMEPEMVKTQQIDGRTFAFIGLERVDDASAVAIYDVTNPYESQYIDLLHFDGSEKAEGIEFIATQDDGSGVLMVSNEDSGTLDFYSVFEYLDTTIGSTTALIPEASAADEASELLDGQSGDTAFPYADFKPLATVGEMDADTGVVLTGYPDGHAAWLADEDTIRVAYQSESYGHINDNYNYNGNPEAYGHVMASGVSFTGSRVHTIDYDRQGFADFLDNGNPASDIVEGSGFLYDTIFNGFGLEVMGANGNPDDLSAKWGNQTTPDGTVIPFVEGRQNQLADWTLQSFCGAHYEQAEKYGTDIGFVDDIWLTAEEWSAGEENAFAPINADSESLAASTLGLASIVVDVENAIAYTAPALGQTGYEKLLPVNTGHTDYVALVAAGYNHNSEPAPNRIYIGEKDKQADGSAFDYIAPVTADFNLGDEFFSDQERANFDAATAAYNRDAFLARNGLLHGRLYGLALNEDTFADLGLEIDLDAKMVDAYMTDADAPDHFEGRFYPTSYQWGGFDQAQRAVSDTEMHLWVDEGEQPEGYFFFNGDTKTEHPAVDPDYSNQRYIQNMTDEGGLLAFEFDGMTEILNDLSGGLPEYLPVDVTRLLAAVDGELTLKTDGKGVSTSGESAAQQIEKGTNGVQKLVSPDGLQWIKGADGDVLILDEDSGNDHGERKMALVLDTETMAVDDAYFLAQAGGSKNARDQAGATAIGGAAHYYYDDAGNWVPYATTAEFSGTWDVSHLVAKENGSFLTAADLAGTGAQDVANAIDLNDKTLIGVVQHRSSSGGVVSLKNADAGGQLFQFSLDLPELHEMELQQNAELDLLRWNPGHPVNFNADGYSVGSDIVQITDTGNNSNIAGLASDVDVVDLTASRNVHLFEPTAGFLVSVGRDGMLSLSDDVDNIIGLGNRGNIIRGGIGGDLYNLDDTGNSTPDVLKDFQVGIDHLSVGSKTYGHDAEVEDLRKLSGVDITFTPDLRTAPGHLHLVAGQTNLLGAGLRVAKTDADIEEAVVKVTHGAKLMELGHLPESLNLDYQEMGTKLVITSKGDSIAAGDLHHVLRHLSFDANGAKHGTVEVTATDETGLVATTTIRDFDLVTAKPTSVLRPEVMKLQSDAYGFGGNISFSGISDKGMSVVGTDMSDAVELNESADGIHTVYAHGGHDVITAPKGRAFLMGGDGDDILLGSAHGYVNLNGGSGDDHLIGGSIDLLNGSIGDDTLIALGGGNDLFGGQGADKFVLADTFLMPGMAANRVTDFTPGEDKLVFAGHVRGGVAPSFVSGATGTNVILDGHHIATLADVQAGDIVLGRDVEMMDKSLVSPLTNSIAAVADVYDDLAVHSN